jgi:hypothetical protein
MTVSGTPILDLQGWQALLDKEFGKPSIVRDLRLMVAT